MTAASEIVGAPPVSSAGGLSCSVFSEFRIVRLRFRGYGDVQVLFKDAL